MSNGHFDSYGGGIDQTAIIGHPPEHRDWTPDAPMYAPILGEGVRVEAYVTVDAGLHEPTRIGARTWLLKGGTHVGHDAQVGEDCEIACGAKIGGHARLGDRVKVGLNAVVLPFVEVGTGARIGAGAVVTQHVPPGETWAGVPARRLLTTAKWPELAEAPGA